MSTAAANVNQDIELFARLLFRNPGDVAEIRMPKNNKQPSTISGYFDNVQDFVKGAKLAEKKSRQAVYVTLNPCKPSLLARAENRLEDRAERTTADEDIIRRQWLYIDVDAVRPAGISSSHEEHQAALDLAREIIKFLNEDGFSDFVFADSGNGAHILYSIDLPNTPEATETIKRILDRLDAAFSSTVAKVDTAVHNASRICKVYGTTVRKGDSTSARPHRLSRILEITPSLTAYSFEQLKELAGPPAAPKQNPAPFTRSTNRLPDFDMQAFIDRHGIETRGGARPAKDGQKWVLKSCLNPEHKGTSAVLLQGVSGIPTFHCSHVSCSYKWRDFRGHYEPGYLQRNYKVHQMPARPAEPTTTPAKPEATQPEGPDTPEILPAVLAVKQSDAPACFSRRLLEQLAGLDAASYAVNRRKLRDEVGSSLNLNELDKAVKEARGRSAAAARKARSTVAQFPCIQINSRELRDVSDDSLTALLDANDPPHLFVRAGEVARIGRDEHGRNGIDDVDSDHMLHAMTRAADFLKVTKNKNGDLVESATFPPLQVARDILATPRHKIGFPPLEGVIEAPIIRPDGTVLDKPGYDAATRLYYAPSPDLQMPPVPEDPTRQQRMMALDLFKEMVEDFPWANAAGMANTLGAHLTPVMRRADDGHAPLGVVDAPAAGTGKTLIPETVGIVQTGTDACLRPAPKGNDEEWRKAITTALYRGTTLIIFDNVVDVVESASLALALTASVWTDRLLGQNKDLILTQKSSWFLTGNNIILGSDIPRRCYSIRLDAGVSRPWQRTKFKHADLKGWVKANRARILHALLTIARAWFAAGKPAAKNVSQIGSFETWCQTIGGIIEHAGVTGFLSNLNDLYDNTDPSQQQWEAFLSAVSFVYGTGKFTAGDVALQVGKQPNLKDTLPDDLTELKAGESLQRKLGRELVKRVGTRHGLEQYHLIKAGVNGQKVIEWRIGKKK